MRIRTPLPFLLLALAAGCNLQPDYTRPAPPVPGAWPGPEAKPIPPASRWQDSFPDPGMQAVIRLALAHNRDLRAAALNVVKAQALFQIRHQARHRGARKAQQIGRGGEAAGVHHGDENLHFAVFVHGDCPEKRFSYYLL